MFVNSIGTIVIVAKVGTLVVVDRLTHDAEVSRDIPMSYFVEYLTHTWPMAKAWSFLAEQTNAINSYGTKYIISSM